MFLFEFLDGHLVLADQFGIFLEEFLGVGLENLPGRVGDDGIETATQVENLVEFETPVERAQRLHVRQGQCAFVRFAGFAFGNIPTGLLEFDAAAVPLVEQYLVQRYLGAPPLLLDTEFQLRQIGIVSPGYRIPINMDIAVFFIEGLPVALAKQIILRAMLTLEFMRVDP